MKIETALSIDEKKIVEDGCMLTYSGEIINLMKPYDNIYEIEDIAHGLAFTCRWNGATKTYFSVAEHCCIMFDAYMNADMVELAKTALFHDCEEAYWGDIIKPLKKLLPANIQKCMVNTRDAIFKAFEIAPICDEIERMDFESLQWDFDNLIMDNKHYGWDCYRAEYEWLKRFNITKP